MANPVLVHPEKRDDRSGITLDAGGFAVDGKQVLKAQEATILDAAASTVAATTLVPNTGIVRAFKEVDASAFSGVTETALFTMPARSLLLCVEAKVIEAFDGDTTTTFEVGLTGNIDQWIDGTDFEPETLNLLRSNLAGSNNDETIPTYHSTAQAFVSTAVNDSNNTAGKVEVTAHYITLTDIGLDTVDTQFAAALVDLDLHRTAINAILTALENHGILADA